MTVQHITALLVDATPNVNRFCLNLIEALGEISDFKRLAGAMYTAHFLARVVIAGFAACRTRGTWPVLTSVGLNGPRERAHRVDPELLGWQSNVMS